MPPLLTRKCFHLHYPCRLAIRKTTSALVGPSACLPRHSRCRPGCLSSLASSAGCLSYLITYHALPGPCRGGRGPVGLLDVRRSRTWSIPGSARGPADGGLTARGPFGGLSARGTALNGPLGRWRLVAATAILALALTGVFGIYFYWRRTSLHWAISAPGTTERQHAVRPPPSSTSGRSETAVRWHNRRDELARRLFTDYPLTESACVAC